MIIFIYIVKERYLLNYITMKKNIILILNSLLIGFNFLLFSKNNHPNISHMQSLSNILPLNESQNTDNHISSQDESKINQNQSQTILNQIGSSIYNNPMQVPKVLVAGGATYGAYKVGKGIYNITNSAANVGSKMKKNIQDAGKAIVNGVKNISAEIGNQTQAAIQEVDKQVDNLANQEYYENIKTDPKLDSYKNQLIDYAIKQKEIPNITYIQQKIQRNKYLYNIKKKL